MAKKMLIDATHPEETRVVVVDGQKVDDFDFESINKKQLAGNIYLAKVTRVEPSLQAAFVEYGGNRHGFLAFSEVHPDYYQIPVADREALLAEEKREEEAYARTQDEEDEKPQRQGRKRSRTRGRRRRDKDDQAGETAVAGLEVIDVEGGDAEALSATGDPVAQAVDDPLATVDLADGPDAIEGFEAPKPAEVATDAEPPVEAEATEEAVADAASDADPAGHGDAAEPETTEAASADAQPEDVAAADIPVVEETDPVTDPAPETSDDPALADAPDVATEENTPSVATEPGVEEAPSEDPETPPAPKTMLESSGLDEDRVSEDPEARRRTATSDEVEAEASPAPAETDAEAAAPEQPASELKPDAETETPVAEDIPATEPAADVVSEPASDAADSEPQSVAEPTTDTADTEGAATAPEDQAVETADSEVAQAETAPEETSSSRPSKRSRKGRTSAKTPDDADDQDAEDGDDEDEDDGVESVGADDMAEEVAASRARLRRRYKIQDVIKVRQIMLVQVVKEERGNKGAALTTYLSLAGRYCVLMPNTARGGGISRKITNASDRKRLREVVGELDVPTGMGLIVRTAGAERTRPEIKRDYEFLIRQWEQIRDLTLKSVAPCLIYEEGSLIKRSIRDLYSKEIDAILVEGEAGYREAKDYMKMLMPSHAKNVQQYGDQVPLYIRYQVETYLNGMFNPVVQLKSGGYIVIGITEALVAIDVNSGRSTKEGSIEDTALKTNLEAADEVARQLRLRDLAGLIVIDFIDMDENRNNRAVEKRMKDRLKTDRARIQVGRISAFGLMEMSRQRLRPGMLEATTQPCPHCSGMGLIRSDENLSLSILREVEEEAVRKRASEIVVTCPVDVANYLVNHKREHIAMIEARCQIAIQVMGDPALTSPNFKIDRMKTTTRTIAAAPVITAESGVQDDDDDAVEDAVVVTETTALSDENGGDGDGRSRRRRGRRGGSRRRRPDQNEGEGENEGADASVDADGEGPVEGTEDHAASRSDGDEDGGGRRRGRRRRGRGRRGRNENGDASEGTEGATDAVAAGAVAETIAEDVSDSASAPAEAGSDETPQDAASEPTALTDADPMPTEASAPESDAASEDVTPTAAIVDEPEVASEPVATEPDPVEAESETPDPLPVSEPETETTAPEEPAEAVDQEAIADPTPAPAEATPSEPTAEPTPELATANGDGAAEPAPAEDRPKRRGWWALGARNTD